MKSKRSVIQNSDTSVQSVQFPPETEILSKVRWDDLKLFSDAVEAGSFRGTAALRGVTVNTVRARIARLETDVSNRLLLRSVKGIVPTSAGIELRKIALSMRGGAQGILQGKERPVLVCPGELRIGASEALGSGWLTPHLLELQNRCPGLTISMLCENDLEYDRSAELDIGIAWNSPGDRELIVSRLATVHFMPFASEAYLEEFGIPDSIDDLVNHRFIEQIGPGIKSGLLDQLIGTGRPNGFMPIRTNSSLALFWAVASGAGIAFMPTYAMGVTRKLVPVDLPFQLKFDLFYYYHPEARKSEPVQTAIAWLKELFDPVIYPWFKSEFVHPRKFTESLEASNMFQLFEPFVGKGSQDSKILAPT